MEKKSESISFRPKEKGRRRGRSAQKGVVGRGGSDHCEGCAYRNEPMRVIRTQLLWFKGAIVRKRKTVDGRNEMMGIPKDRVGYDLLPPPHMLCPSNRLLPSHAPSVPGRGGAGGSGMGILNTGGASSIRGQSGADGGILKTRREGSAIQ